MQEKINISLDKSLWDGLAKFAHSESLKGNKRFPTIKALRLSVKTFLRLTPGEINKILKRQSII